LLKRSYEIYEEADNREIKVRSRPDSATADFGVCPDIYLFKGEAYRMNKLKVSFTAAAVVLLARVSSCASDSPQPADHASNQQVKQAETASSKNFYASIPSDEIQHAVTEVEFI
jgi:hypothetical protein